MDIFQRKSHQLMVAMIIFYLLLYPDRKTKIYEGHVRVINAESRILLYAMPIQDMGDHCSPQLPFFLLVRLDLAICPNPCSDNHTKLISNSHLFCCAHIYIMLLRKA